MRLKIVLSLFLLAVILLSISVYSINIQKNQSSINQEPCIVTSPTPSQPNQAIVESGWEIKKVSANVNEFWNNNPSYVFPAYYCTVNFTYYANETNDIIVRIDVIYNLTNSAASQQFGEYESFRLDGGGNYQKKIVLYDAGHTSGTLSIQKVIITGQVGFNQSDPVLLAYWDSSKQDNTNYELVKSCLSYTGSITNNLNYTYNSDHQVVATNDNYLLQITFRYNFGFLYNSSVNISYLTTNGTWITIHKEIGIASSNFTSFSLLLQGYKVEPNVEWHLPSVGDSYYNFNENDLLTTLKVEAFGYGP